jgi:hypothetical protein
MGLLGRLNYNVESLETAIVHDWQERMLVEQEQTRSEQEAMAEIERSRRGHDSRRIGDAAYNGVMLILTVVAVVIAIEAVNPGQNAQLSWQRALLLWPAVLLAIACSGILIVISWLRNSREKRRPESGTYSFEFAFRLGQPALPEGVRKHLEADQPIVLSAAAPFRKIVLRTLGGWRVERVSRDTTLIKVHSVAVVKVAHFRSARFEIVTEIMTRTVSDTSELFLRQCRMFGDSPVPIKRREIEVLVRALLDGLCRPMMDNFDTELEKLIGPVRAGLGGAS